MTHSAISLRVRQIIIERYDVKSFVFERIDGRELAYRAGQFLTFLIPMHGHEVRRSYSMSSAPAVDLFPAITVKRVPNGEVSRFWIDTVREGDVLQVLEPSGRFTLDQENVSRDIVMIGGGSGITPLFSLLKQALATEERSFITLFYANRNERSTLFSDQIRQLEQRHPDRFKVIHLHSQPDDDWIGIRGRINNARLEQMLSSTLHYDKGDARFFICGPPELMRTVDITLHYLGFGKEQIRKENFVIEKMPPPPPVSFPHTVEIAFRGNTYKITVPAHTAILDAALSNGINLPYSCKGGRCSTCGAICKSGKIHMSVNEVLTDQDLAEGWILTCSAYPDSDDVRIEI